MRHASSTGNGWLGLAAVLDDLLQVGAVDVLHDDEVGVVTDADVEDLNAVRVRKAARTGAPRPRTCAMNCFFSER